jgi:hypothetical protein
VPEKKDDLIQHLLINLVKLQKNLLKILEIKYHKVLKRV